MLAFTKRLRLPSLAAAWLAVRRLASDSEPQPPEAFEGNRAFSPWGIYFR